MEILGFPAFKYETHSENHTRNAVLGHIFPLPEQFTDMLALHLRVAHDNQPKLW
jgi:hypothetical protein